jgi:hypothetical protein
MSKSIDGKELLKEVKESTKQKKKEKEMKNIKENQTVKTIVHVALTLLAVATIAAAFLAGMNYQKGLEAEKSAAITASVEQLKQ